jgi:predicted TIM-barrel fold metal-dependent hydrolase
MPMGGREVSAATAAAMNDEMSKASAAAPSRIKYFASLPWEYEEAAIAELHRARGRRRRRYGARQHQPRPPHR